NATTASGATTASSRDVTTTERRGRATEAAAALKREAPQSPSMPVGSAASLDSSSRFPTARGRHIPAAVRRAVYERDGARCTFVDTATGRRCAETHTLELHHEVPFARGGAHAVDNLTLRCRAHNALAAERDYGGRYMAQRNKSPRHESYARVR